MAKKENLDYVGLPELTGLVQQELGLRDITCTKKDATEIIRTVFACVSACLLDKAQVRIPEFGSFIPTERAARTAHNPQNPNEKIDVPAKVVVTFKISKSLKDQMPSTL